MSVELGQARSAMESDGFLFAPRLVDGDLLGRVHERMDAWISGAAGIPAPVDPTKLVKIDNVHHHDPVILEVVSSAEVGRWAAEITGAERVQVWETQLLHKPPGGATTGTVGWHQDQLYWKDWMGGEVLTAWIAVSDVPEAAGPVRFVERSHRWGFLEAGNFFGNDLEALRADLNVPPGETWEETPAVLSAGEVSFHHKLTIHGSRPNVALHARRGFAVHLRTERSWVMPGAPPTYPDVLDDLDKCPVVFGGN